MKILTRKIQKNPYTWGDEHFLRWFCDHFGTDMYMLFFMKKSRFMSVYISRKITKNDNFAIIFGLFSWSEPFCGIRFGGASSHCQKASPINKIRENSREKSRVVIKLLCTSFHWTQKNGDYRHRRRLSRSVKTDGGAADPKICLTQARWNCENGNKIQSAKSLCNFPDLAGHFAAAAANDSRILPKSGPVGNWKLQYQFDG